MSVRRAATAERRKSVDLREADTVIRDDADEGSSNPSRGADREDKDGADGDGKRDLLQLIHRVSVSLCSIKEDGEELAAGFQRIPNRRVLPDYFEIISDPVAFSTIRGKVQKKQYTSFLEFVKDVAQICHNAQFYNRPSAPIFGAAVRLREVFRDELKKLVDQGDISASDATMPDLGELPPADESSSRDSEASDADGEELDDEQEEDEDDGDGDDGDDDEVVESNEYEGFRRQRQRQRNRGIRQSTSGRKDNNIKMNDDTYKRRGRPPMLLTPMEARIFSILKELRKLEDDESRLLTSSFEKLPDKTLNADYYNVVTNPIALDSIKKKAKQKKYQTVDEVLADLDLMFENAKIYNEDGSEVFRAAVELQQRARLLASQEKRRPDDDFRDEDGKLPLAEVQHNGQTWKVGDWVHIRNPNDLAKPIVAQIFRTWQEGAGQKWINACWYYRPEQTVHRHEKHFFDREVVKTGQYRDHQIADVLDRCFVMFVTRFNKGRPRGFPPDKDVYVCESRYNEEKFRFNKIKTWASCLPDEVREKDYEMDLFDAPSRMKKIPSPIKHLLREDAKETDELPRPIWGSPNAPPIIGAVHRRKLEANESPPPEPAPPPPSAAPMVHAQSSTYLGVREGPMVEASGRGGPFQGPAPNPGHYSHGQMGGAHFQPAGPAPGMSLVFQTPVPIPHTPHHVAQAPPHVHIRPLQYHPHPQPHPPQAQQQNSPAGYARKNSSAVASLLQPMGTSNSSSQVQLPQPGRAAFASAARNSAPHATIYNPSRPSEVYTLTDGTNDALPSTLRQGFQRDEAGRVLFFTAPPLDRHHKGLSPGGAGLGHSIRYLAGRNAWLAEREKKRKWRDEGASEQNRMHRKNADETKALDPVVDQAAKALDWWFYQFDHETDEWRTNAGLSSWSGVACSR